MAQISPVDLKYGTVIGTFKTIEVDSDDSDELPDHYPMTGTITFTSSVARTQYISPVTGESIIFYRTKIVCALDSNGTLIVPNNTTTLGVRLMPTNSPELQPNGWTWKADFNLASVNNRSGTIAIPSVDFELHEDQIIDLPKLIPVESSPGVGIPAMESAVLRAEEAASKVAFFAGETNPQMTQPGLWLQTGLGDGSDYTLWIEDGQ